MVKSPLNLPSYLGCFFVSMAKHCLVPHKNLSSTTRSSSSCEEMVTSHVQKMSKTCLVATHLPTKPGVNHTIRKIVPQLLNFWMLSVIDLYFTKNKGQNFYTNMFNTKVVTTGFSRFCSLGIHLAFHTKMTQKGSHSLAGLVLCKFLSLGSFAAKSRCVLDTKRGPRFCGSQFWNKPKNLNGWTDCKQPFFHDFVYIICLFFYGTVKKKHNHGPYHPCMVRTFI